jgi:hypothetical protein
MADLWRDLQDTWDRNGSTRGPTPWQINDNDDDDDDEAISMQGFPNIIKTERLSDSCVEDKYGIFIHYYDKKAQLIIGKK